MEKKERRTFWSVSLFSLWPEGRKNKSPASNGCRACFIGTTVFYTARVTLPERRHLVQT